MWHEPTGVVADEEELRAALQPFDGEGNRFAGGKERHEWQDALNGPAVRIRSTMVRHGMELWRGTMQPEVLAVVKRSLALRRDHAQGSRKLTETTEASMSKSETPDDSLRGKDYDKELKKLHGELVELQQWVVHKGLKVCVVFEGRDGAGKGGAIKAITERVSPRVFRVVALPAPTTRESSQMYIQRYIPHLPAAGEIVIFDRSWYNRAGVERVMGFTEEKVVARFLRGISMVEMTMALTSGRDIAARLSPEWNCAPTF